MQHMQKLSAPPGIALVTPLEEESLINLGTQKQARMKRGKIVSMGKDITTDYGTKIYAIDYGKEGNIIWFLHYYEAGGVDYIPQGNQKYYTVLWKDFRAIEL